MAITIADAQDAWLSGKADVSEWADEFDSRWFEPLAKTMMRMLWARMTPEQHAALREANPQAHDAVQEMLFPGGGSHGL